MGRGCARVPVLPLQLSSALSESVTPRSFLESSPFWSDGHVCKTRTLSVMRLNESWRGSKQGPGVYQDPASLSLNRSSDNQEIFPLPCSLPTSPAPAVTRDPKPQPPAFVLSCFSCVRLFATPWTMTCQASLSVGFSRQEYWSGLLCPPPGDLPDPGSEAVSLMSPALAGVLFTTSGICLGTWNSHCAALN